MQIETTQRFHLTPVRMAIFKSKNNKCWWGCGEIGTLIYYWWKCNLVQLLWKAVWRFLKKLNKELPYDPVTPLLGIYPKECNSGYNRDTCTSMFIAALLTIAKLWKPRCPTIDEWIKKMWHTYTTEYYSAIKKNEIMLFAGKWMELEDIMLSEVNHVQKDKGHMFSLLYGG
jgi:hypothetical protein